LPTPPGPPAFKAPLGAPRQNVAMTFGVEKLKLCGYQTVKNFEDSFTSFDRIRT